MILIFFYFAFNLLVFQDDKDAVSSLSDYDESLSEVKRRLNKQYSIKWNVI